AALPAWLADLDEPVSGERRAQAMAAVERARFRRPAASGWGSRGMLAAAATVALMLTVAFGTPPGRAWVGGAAEWLGIRQPEAGPTEVAPVVVPPGRQAAAPAADSAAGTTTPGEAAAPTAAGPGARVGGLPPGMAAPVRFNPTGNYVLLQVDSRQRVGNITVWVEDRQTAEGQVVAGRTGETLEPLGDGVRVRNARSSRADYTVRVPTRYRFIRVKIGDEPETTIAVSRANRAWVWNVSLADGGS
ncbi:MAG TPA: hypothetical protein VHG08_13690, partial [Longimicrobium sp.]|nr:hypothetical protein [Longimicrobium sp.]